jgi:acyl-CoA synthetase (AMP-forming)/AMP-acid ligase II
MYGQTEASPRISFLDWKYAFKKNGSIGKNIKSVKIWLEDENNKKIYTPGKIGEIVIIDQYNK